jgi:hypothetical protein
MGLQWYREHALPNSPMPIPVSARYMVWVCSGSIAGIVRFETHWGHACSSRVCHAESSLCYELITRSEQPYGMCVCVCVSNYVWSIHSQKMMRASFDLGCCATKKKWLNKELYLNSNIQGCCYQSPPMDRLLSSFNKINILKVCFERHSFNIIFRRRSQSTKGEFYVVYLAKIP